MASPSVGEIQTRYLVLQGLRWLPVGFIAPILVLVLTREITLAQLGPLIAIYGATTALLELPTGGLADSIGRRPVLLASSLCSVGFFGLLLLSTNIFVLAGALFLGGVGRALDSGPLESWFVDETKAIDSGTDIQAGLSRGGAVDGTMLAVGSVLGGILPRLANGRLSAAVLAALIFQVVHFAAVLILMDEHARAIDSESGGATKSVWDPLRAGVRIVSAEGSLRRLLAGGATIGVALVAIETLWQPRFVDLLERDDVTVFLGILLAIAFAGGAVGAFLGPALQRAVGAWISPAVVGQLASAVALVVLAAVSWAPAAAVAFVLFYVFNGLTSPIRSALLHDRVAPQQRSTVLSADSLAFQGGGFLAALTLPAFASQYGIPRAWIVAAVCLFVGSLLYRTSEGGAVTGTESPIHDGSVRRRE